MAGTEAEGQRGELEEEERPEDRKERVLLEGWNTSGDTNWHGTQYKGYQYQLPFEPEATRLSEIFAPYAKGAVCQGINGQYSHTGLLAFAIDFAMPTGTRVLAARGGTVAACEGSFRKGGVKQELKIKANYIAIRHADGTYGRYYHLRHKGVRVKAGEQVKAGQWIGLSGNTGFTSGPHLHFDVIDTLSTETCTLKLCREERLLNDSGGTNAAAGGPGVTGLPAPEGWTWECKLGATAAFSGDLPPPGEMLEAEVVVADPPDAIRPIDPASAKGRIVLVDRCGQTGFLSKAQRVAEAGGLACVVINNDDAPVVHVMAGGGFRTVDIPVIMVTKEFGDFVKQHLVQLAALGKNALSQSEGKAAAGSTRQQQQQQQQQQQKKKKKSTAKKRTGGLQTGLELGWRARQIAHPALRLVLGRSDHYRDVWDRTEFRDLCAPRHPTVSPFVSVSLPVRFQVGEDVDVVPGLGKVTADGRVEQIKGPQRTVKGDPSCAIQ